jgi:pilus assembly protein Flp/PilA
MTTFLPSPGCAQLGVLDLDPVRRACRRVGFPGRGNNEFALDSALTEETMRNRLIREMLSFLKQEDGPTAVEYAVMLALIIVVCIAAITTLGGNANATFSNVALNTTMS